MAKKRKQPRTTGGLTGTLPGLNDGDVVIETGVGQQTVVGGSNDPSIPAAPASNNNQPVLPTATNFEEPIQDLLARLTAAEEEAKQSNLQRFDQGLAIQDQIADIFRPGGSFGAGLEDQLARQKQQAVSQGRQDAIAAGLANTSVGIPSEIARGFEETVGTPRRLQIADIQAQNLANALQQKSGFIERRQDIGPDPNTIAALTQQIATAPLSGQEFKTENRRQQQLAQAERKTERFSDQIADIESKINELRGQGKAGQVRTQEKRLARKQEQLQEAQQQAQENAQPTVSPLRFNAELQQRRQLKAAQRAGESDDPLGGFGGLIGTVGGTILAGGNPIGGAIGGALLGGGGGGGSGAPSPSIGSFAPKNSAGAFGALPLLADQFLENPNL